MKEEIDENLVIADRVKGEVFRKKIRDLPSELRVSPSSQLETRFDPTLCDRKLKASLWSKIEKMNPSEPRISQKKIYEGICSSTHWQKNILSNDIKLAWLVQPPIDTDLAIEAVTYSFLDRCHEILQLPLKDEDGKVNTALVSAIVKMTIRLMDTREAIEGL